MVISSDTQRELSQETEQLRELKLTCMDNLLATPEARVYFKDLQSRFLLVSAGCDATVPEGHTLADLIGKTDFDFYSEEHAAAAFADEQQIIRTGQPVVGKLERETFHDRPDAWASTSKMPLRSADGKIIGTFGVTRDVTALVMAEEASTEAEQRFRLAFEANTSPMVFTDLDNQILAANDAFCHLVGHPLDEVLGHNSAPFTHPDDIGVSEAQHQIISSTGLDSVSYTKRYLRPDGAVVIVEVSKSPARDADGRTLYYVISERDVTAERFLTEQLTHQALHDPLTGLANRNLFEDRLSQVFAAQDRGTGTSCSVLLIDLDDFKGVNDTHGHLVGDQLLLEVTRRLLSVTRATDTLSRFGGDEFLYLAPGASSAEAASSVAERLLSALAEPFVLGDVTLIQHASVGVVLARPGLDTVSSIIANADTAMYESKHVAPGSFTHFEPRMHTAASDRFALAQELRKALENSLLEVHYQPICDLTTSKVLGFEALARWTHPVRGSIPPVVFIPVAEQSGLILPLGDYVLARALADAASWGPDEEGAPYVTVNLSSRQFLDPELFTKVSAALTEHALSPSRLVLEITESTLMCDLARSLSLIESLTSLGVGFALDDFGTGYSSLSYLSLLNPRILKIDRSFIDPAVPSARHDTLLEAIVALGRALNITVLAEGIETVAQAERLRSLNCELAQGFLFSPAVPVRETHDFLGDRVLP